MATPLPQKLLVRAMLPNYILKGLLKPERLSLRMLMLILSISI